METILFNISASVKYVTKHGRDYIVVPLTMMVPGVLNGSKGALYYPPEEIARDHQAWNGIPIVVNHPHDPVTREPVSARDPEVLANYEVGRVYKTKAQGKLTAEGWFDVASTKRVSPSVYDSLRAGKRIELSTGLFTENELAPDGSHHNGKPYAFVARNYRPDHLAILPDHTGACSIRDGCGVLVNKGTDTVTQANATKDTTLFLPENLLTNEELGVGSHFPHDSLRLKAVNRLLVGNALVEGSKEEEAAETPEEEAKEPPTPAEEAAANAMSRTALAKKANKDNKSLEHLKAHHAHREAATEQEKAGNDDQAATHRKMAMEHKYMSDQMANNKGTNDMDRNEIIEHLTTNCDCWKGDDGKETLNALSDDRLQKIKDDYDKVQTLTANRQTAATGTPPPPPKAGEELMSESDWLAKAPPSVQATLNYARTIEQKEKDALVARIVVNVKGTENKTLMVNKLRVKSIPELQEWLMVAGPTPNAPTQNQGLPAYYMPDVPGFSPIPTVNDENDILALPSMDYEAKQETA